MLIMIQISKQYLNKRLNRIEALVSIIIVAASFVAFGSISLGLHQFYNAQSTYKYLYPYISLEIMEIPYYLETVVGYSLLSAFGGILIFTILSIVYQYKINSILSETFPTFVKGQGYWVLCIPIIGPIINYFKFKKLTLEIKKHTGDLEDGINKQAGSIFELHLLSFSLWLFAIFTFTSPTLITVTIPLMLHMRIEEFYFNIYLLIVSFIYALFLAGSFLMPARYLYLFNKQLKSYLEEYISSDSLIPSMPTEKDGKTYTENIQAKINNIKNSLTVKEPEEDFVAKLDKLEKMYNRGALTEEEYSQAKAAILSKN